MTCQQTTRRTTDQQVAALTNEGYPAWWNRYARSPAKHSEGERLRLAFEAGVRAALTQEKAGV